MQRSLSLCFGALSSSTLLALSLASIGCGGSSSDGGVPSEGGGSPDAGGDSGNQTDSATPPPPDGGGNQTDSATPPPPDGVIAVPLLACVPLVYGADFTVGTQDFRVLVDTGSTSFGVAGSTCTTCNTTPLYTPGASAVDQHKTATSQFGSGQWKGEIFEDSVGPSGMVSVPMKLVSLTSQTGIFQDGSTCGGKPYQGLLGFSQPASAVAGTNGFFDQFVANKKGADVFATELCDDGGTLWLGGFDPAATTAAPQYVPFTTDSLSSAYYSVDLQSISVNGTSVPITGSQSNDTFVDTGTSAFILADTVYSKLTAAIAAAPGVSSMLGSTFFTQSGNGLPGCANLKQTKAEIDAALPALTLKFAGGVSVQALATESYLMPYQGLGFCNALLSQPAAQFPIGSILGAPIMRSNVFIFDRAQKRLGIAPHKECPSARTVGRKATLVSAAPLPPRIGPSFTK